MTEEAELAKQFVLSIYAGAKFVRREEMPNIDAFAPTPDDCQIMDADRRHSLAMKWSYNENDAWIDARNFINFKMMQRLES